MQRIRHLVLIYTIFVILVTIAMFLIRPLLGITGVLPSFLFGILTGAIIAWLMVRVIDAITDA